MNKEPAPEFYSGCGLCAFIRHQSQHSRPQSGPGPGPDPTGLMAIGNGSHGHWPQDYGHTPSCPVRPIALADHRKVCAQPEVCENVIQLAPLACCAPWLPLKLTCRHHCVHNLIRIRTTAVSGTIAPHTPAPGYQAAYARNCQQKAGNFPFPSLPCSVKAAPIHRQRTTHPIQICHQTKQYGFVLRCNAPHFTAQ